MSNPADSAAAAPKAARSRRKRAWFALIGALCVLAAVEGACRVYWWTRGVPLLKSPARMHAPLYPRLAWVEQQWVGEDDLYDVLILGGSVVSDGFGSVGAQLAEELTARHGVRVRVHNVGARAHTSRDSLLKYRRLWRQKFDLVIVYHGINEVRTNNCPPEMFRADYTHYAWYQAVEQAEGWSNKYTAVPFTVARALSEAAIAAGSVEVVPTHEPKAAWLDYGAELKSVPSFRANLEEICEVAAGRGEPVLLGTFATHVADGYDRQRFHKLELDYTTHFCPIELWGRPDNVIAGVAAHNAVLPDLAASFDHVGLAETAEKLPKGKRWFNDVCHLTHVGCRELAVLLADAVDANGVGPK